MVKECSGLKYPESSGTKSDLKFAPVLEFGLGIVADLIGGCSSALAIEFTFVATLAELDRPGFLGDDSRELRGLELCTPLFILIGSGVLGYEKAASTKCGIM